MIRPAARARWRGVAGRALAAALSGVAATAGPAAAQGDDATSQWLASAIQVRAEVTPKIVRIGERASYRARVVVPRGFRVDWGEPERAPDLTWGAAETRTRDGRTPGRRQGAARAQPGRTGNVMDTTWREIAVQAFEPGRRVLAGVPFTVVHRGGQFPAFGPNRVPQVALDVVLTLSPADSNARLHDLHGPVAAPWWERVPWRYVLAAVAALVLAFVLWRLLRRRKPAPAPVAAPAAALDPRAQALRSLATLRAEKLPEAGRLAEHAFRLGRILRTYLESTVPVTRPGDTTPELIAHLAGAGADAEELRRLSGLLRVWDRVKFAREPLSTDEAHAGEAAVENVIRRDRPLAASGAVAGKGAVA